MVLVYFADLSHPSHVTKTFPLGISCVASYAKQELKDLIDIKLFKLPDDLEKAFSFKKPDILCLSNYPWNLQLAYIFAKAAKETCPDLIIVFGGPNFPLADEKQLDFLQKFPIIDFYIFGEGEEGFVDLVRKLMAVDMKTSTLQKKRVVIQNCIYCHKESLIRGEIRRIQNLDKIPSPYLSGVLDDFFALPLIPLVETTRGCPFKCTFCGSGLDYKSRVVRYTERRVSETIEYIANHVQHCDELIMADLNFGMFEFDLKTCKVIARLQTEKNYPKVVKASAGKNKPEMVFDAVRILDNSWHVGLALQSTDVNILLAIKRSNISNQKMIDLANYGSKTDTLTYTEIILGLPNDSKEKHFESLRFAVDSGFNSIRMYQLFLLQGTEIVSEESRKKYGMVTKWRIIPGCIGTYRFFGKKYCIGEPEEIVVGNKALSLEDYLECRLMDCIVEVFTNNAWFEEIFALVRNMKLSLFDLLLYFKNHTELYSEKMRSILNNFLKEAQSDMYNTREEIVTFLQKPEIIEKYLNGELGSNEILNTKALCYLDFKETNEVFYNMARCFMREKHLLTEKVNDYLIELEKFNLMRKSELFEKTERKYKDYFKYNFKLIEKHNFESDPNSIQTSQRYLIEMYHNEEQISLINNSLNIYGTSLAGLGKLIQRANFKDFYRNYKQQPIMP